MKEKDIKHENGVFWVGDTGDSYTVYEAHVCHYSVPDSSYARDQDGLSIAVARCNYLAHRAEIRKIAAIKVRALEGA